MSAAQDEVSWGMRIRESAWIWLPMLVVVALAAPSIEYMLPSFESHLGENYQPLKALRFFSSPTTDYHKYGPMTNFLLAPGYALSLGYWWLSGDFADPSGDFPYGLERPLEQISFMLLQGRLLFLLLFVSLSIVSLRWLRDATPNRTAIAAAYLFCLGTNYCAMGFVANTRPDGPMFAFLLLSLALYVRILSRGLSVRRGVGLSLLAVFAISSKEVAATVYVMPYLGLGWLELARWRSRPEERVNVQRTVVATLASGVGAYFVLNTIYAPAIWWERMNHWLGGGGTDSEIWGGLGSGAMSQLGFAVFLFESFLNTLGPAGLLAVVVALAVLLIRRPEMWLLSMLPFLSVLGLGLIPLGYGSDYFTTVATVALIPAVALGFAGLWEWIRPGSIGRPLVLAVLAIGLGLNFMMGTFAWHRLDGFFMRVVERELAVDPPGRASIAIPEPHPHIPGKSRLAWLGYDFDPRSIQQILDAEPASRPDRIYVSVGQVQFIEDALAQPARADVLQGEGLDISGWNGFEGLGYELEKRVTPATPAWFVFDGLPAVRLWAELRSVLVYERSPVGAS